MTRAIVGEFIGGANLDKVWPAPVDGGPSITWDGASGIEDPLLRRTVESAAAELARADRTREPRNPESVARLRGALAEAGLLGLAMESVA